MKPVLHKKGNISVGVIIAVLIVSLIALTLIPQIKQAITDATGNLSTAELALVSLVPLGIVIGLLFLAFKGSGIKGM